MWLKLNQAKQRDYNYFSSMFLNSVGVQFLHILNMRIKAEMLLNPESKATSVTETSGLINIFSAYMMRLRFRYL